MYVLTEIYENENDKEIEKNSQKTNGKVERWYEGTCKR